MPNSRQTTIWNNDCLVCWRMYASLGPKELTLISDRLHRAVLAVHLHSISCFLTTGNVASCHHVSRKPGAVGPQMGCCVGCAVVAPKGIHVIGVSPDDCHVPTSYHVTDAGENNQMMTSCHGNASITDPLWGESIDPRWVPITKPQWCSSWFPCC